MLDVNQSRIAGHRKRWSSISIRGPEPVPPTEILLAEWNRRARNIGLNLPCPDRRYGSNRNRRRGHATRRSFRTESADFAAEEIGDIHSLTAYRNPEGRPLVAEGAALGPFGPHEDRFSPANSAH